MEGTDFGLRGHQRPELVFAAEAAEAAGTQALDRIAIASAPSRLTRSARLQEESNRFIFAPRTVSSHVAEGEQIAVCSAPLRVAGEQPTTADLLCPWLAGNPAISGHPETGGFASPSCDGFALCVRAHRCRSPCGERHECEVNRDPTLVTKCRAFQTCGPGDKSVRAPWQTNTELSTSSQLELRQLCGGFTLSVTRARSNMSLPRHVRCVGT
jgi:hypothetical protein